MKKEELKIGEYYYYEWTYEEIKIGTAIIFCTEKIDNKIKGNTLYIHTKRYVDNNDYMPIDSTLKRLATPEEIHWYKLCEKEGKYVDKPVFKYKLGEKVIYKEDECEIVDMCLDGSPYYVLTYSKGWRGTGGVEWEACYKTILSKDKKYNYVSEDSITPITTTSSTKPSKTDFNNCKIWIGDNPELNRRVQERLFELGYEWFSRDKHVLHTNSLGLIICNDKRFGKTSDESYFNKSTEKLIKLSDLGIEEDYEIVSKGLMSMIPEWKNVRVVGDPDFYTETPDELLIISKSSKSKTKYIIVDETKAIVYKPIIIKNQLITI